MDKDTKKTNIQFNADKPDGGKSFSADPQAEEINQLRHRNSVMLYKLSPVLVIMGLLFLVVLFFLILPISEMSLTYNNFFWEGFQEWARAFLQTSRTIGIALATLIVSDLLRKVYGLLKGYK